MSQLAFFVDSDKCITCKACGLACKDKNDLAPGRKFRKVYSQSAGSWSVDDAGAATPIDVFSYSISLACNHCAMPLCLAACPVQAIVKRDDGIVYIDQELCTGCKACSEACPYDAPSFDAEASLMGKCDLCRDLIDSGDTPACVRACSMQALEFGELDELMQKHPEAVQQVDPLPSPSESQPSLLIVPRRGYKDGMETINFNMPEEIKASE